MKIFRVNSIFYSLQGEGHNTGRAAVFVRFAGCNLRCPFCDTEFDTYTEMSAEEIVAKIMDIHQVSPGDADIHQVSDADIHQGLATRLTRPRSPYIVLTGGEPTLQVDEAFVDLLHRHGYEVAMESNGTRSAPRNLDWLTVSPKTSHGFSRFNTDLSEDKQKELMVDSDIRIPDELKIVFDEDTDPEAILTVLNREKPWPTTSREKPWPVLNREKPWLTSREKPLLYLQPCDTGDPVRNAAITKACVDYIKHHPQWRLSLQTHKLIGIE